VTTGTYIALLSIGIAMFSIGFIAGIFAEMSFVSWLLDQINKGEDRDE